MARSTNRKIEVQPGLGKKRDPISKITTSKRAGGVAHMVECLPRKCEFKSQCCKKTRAMLRRQKRLSTSAYLRYQHGL
jgi:hypothetical protein